MSIKTSDHFNPVLFLLACVSHGFKKKVLLFAA